MIFGVFCSWVGVKVFGDIGILAWLPGTMAGVYFLGNLVE
jgi:hypothetical protein